MAKSQQTTIRTSISIRRDLKRRMDKVKEPVNWSALAAEAFERKLTEIQIKQENPEMSKVIERLRASQREAESELYQEGWSAGEDWAEKSAEAIELKRLEAWLSNRDFDPYRYENSETYAWSAADCLFFQLHPGDDNDRQSAGFFWECILRDDAESQSNLHEPEFLRGFVEGALDVWDKAKDRL